MTTIIQARLNSSRLPNKVLQKIGDKTIIEHVIDRCKQLTDKVIVAVSDIDDCSIMYELEERDKYKEIEYFHSTKIHPNNLLKRYIMCGIAYDCDYILRVCGDTPFFDISAAKMLIRNTDKYIGIDSNGYTMETNYYDYVAHYLEGEEYPTIWKHSTGQYLEVVRLSALFDVYNRIARKEIKEKEIQYVYGLMDTIDCYKQHPTSGIYLEPERYKIKKIMLKELPSHQLAINTPDDLARVRKLFDSGLVS